MLKLYDVAKLHKPCQDGELVDQNKKNHLRRLVFATYPHNYNLFVFIQLQVNLAHLFPI